MEIIYSLIGQTFVFILISYFIFYKKYLEALANQKAELHNISEKTLKVENIKKVFTEELEVLKKNLNFDLAKEVEPLKAALSKENITHQIFTTEYIKLRFQRLDVLYGKLYELKQYCESNLFYYSDDEDFQKKKNKFKELYKEAEDSLYRSSVYINDVVAASVIDLLNECHNAQYAFTVFYNTDPNREKFIFKLQRQDLLHSMTLRNIDALDRLNNCLDRLPMLLRNIETEFKQNLISPQ